MKKSILVFVFMLATIANAKESNASIYLYSMYIDSDSGFAQVLASEGNIYVKYSCNHWFNEEDTDNNCMHFYTPKSTMQNALYDVDGIYVDFRNTSSTNYFVTGSVSWRTSRGRMNMYNSDCARIWRNNHWHYQSWFYSDSNIYKYSQTNRLRMETYNVHDNENYVNNCNWTGLYYIHPLVETTFFYNGLPNPADVQFGVYR